MLSLASQAVGGRSGSSIDGASTTPKYGEAIVTLDIDRMLVKDLKKELQKRSLGTSGRKADLQKRLREHGLGRKEREDESKTFDTKSPSVSTSVQSSKDTQGQKQDGWRIKAEERRKAALAIRAKRMKIESSGATPKPQTSAVAPTSAVNPYEALQGKTPVNPYAKKATSNAGPTAPKSPANPHTKSSVASYPRIPAAKHKNPEEHLPTVSSAWGDCRLDLWEALCHCGGERMSPDVRMCRCGTWGEAGLACEGCYGGCLLIKSGPRGNFWGCSMYKKKGCKYTKKFGSPYDAAAAKQLAKIKMQSVAKAKREEEEWRRIADPFERDWRSVCRCDGAKELNTYECFLQSEGGCGMLALCPEGCGGGLFLHQSKYGAGKKWWGCSNFKSGGCKFRKNYIDHQ